MAETYKDHKRMIPKPQAGKGSECPQSADGSVKSMRFANQSSEFTWLSRMHPGSGFRA